MSWRRKFTSVFLPGEFHGQRSLVGHSPWGCKELDMTSDWAQTQDRLQHYVNRELPDVKAELEKAEEPEIKLPVSVGSEKKLENSRKTSTFASLWLSLCVDPTNCGKFFKRQEYQTILPASCETCRKVKKQQLDWTWNNRRVGNWERSTSRLYIATLLI